MPKVSVILPNYNHEKFLGERMDSISNQSFTDFEIIVLDDASTDRSIEMLNSWGDQRIKRIIRNENNSGSTFIQWEKGIKETSGEYIWIAESDDISHPEFLEKMVAILDKNPEVMLSFAASTWIDNDGKPIHEPPHETDKHWEPLEIIKGDFLRGNVVYNASSVVFRKTGLPNINFSEITQFKYAGDWLFWVQLIRDNQVYRTSERLNYFRRHDKNVSVKALKEGLHFTEGLEVIRYIFAHYNLSFVEKRKTRLKWSKKIAQSELPQKDQLLKSCSNELVFYTHIFKLLS